MVRGPLHGVFRSLVGSLGQGSGSRIPVGWESESDRTLSDAESARIPVDSPPPARGHVALDIYEAAGYVVIKAPIAGVKLESLDVEVRDNVVVIRGERRNTDDVPADRYYLQECYWGEFSRSVTLPFAVDASRVKASFSRDGVLKVLIPREQRIRIVKISEAT